MRYLSRIGTIPTINNRFIYILLRDIKWEILVWNPSLGGSYQQNSGVLPEGCQQLYTIMESAMNQFLSFMNEAANIFLRE